MAKRTAHPRSAPAAASEPRREVESERAQAVGDDRDSGGSKGAAPADVIGDFAEDLGKLLGTAQAKASSWLDQRKVIADQLAQIRDTANHYLHQLTGGNSSPGSAAAPARRGRPRGSATGKPAVTAAPPAVTAVKRGRPAASKKKGGMSPEGRARVAAAQRARWARVRAARDASR